MDSTPSPPPFPPCPALVPLIFFITDLLCSPSPCLPTSVISYALILALHFLVSGLVTYKKSHSGKAPIAPTPSVSYFPSSTSLFSDPPPISLPSVPTLSHRRPISTFSLPSFTPDSFDSLLHPAIFLSTPSLPRSHLTDFTHHPPSNSLPAPLSTFFVSL